MVCSDVSSTSCVCTIHCLWSGWRELLHMQTGPRQFPPDLEEKRPTRPCEIWPLPTCPPTSCYSLLSISSDLGFSFSSSNSSCLVLLKCKLQRGEWSTSSSTEQARWSWGYVGAPGGVSGREWVAWVCTNPLWLPPSASLEQSLNRVFRAAALLTRAD